MINSQHILVCLDGHPKSHLLVDAAKNMASEMGCSWSVFYVEAPSDVLGKGYAKNLSCGS